jgi:hypothetical protein
MTYKEAFDVEEPNLPCLKRLENESFTLYVKDTIDDRTVNYLLWRLSEDRIALIGLPGPHIRVEKLSDAPSWIPN